MTLLQYVEQHLPKEFIDYENLFEGTIHIKPEYQIEANKIYLRSQAFTSKLTPEQKLEYSNVPEELECRIQLFMIDNKNWIWIFDTTNQKTQSIHVDNLNNY